MHNVYKIFWNSVRYMFRKIFKYMFQKSWFRRSSE